MPATTRGDVTVERKVADETGEPQFMLEPGCTQELEAA
jgi:hypothetical protein